MSLLLKAGITLPNSLERLALDFDGTKLGDVLSGVREQVAIGVPLNQAMARYPKTFSRQITAMVEAGEVSGKLPEVFESLSSYYEWLDQLTGDIRQALILEAAQKHGLTHEGKLIPGVTGKVNFNGRHGRGGGAYTVTLTRDPAQSGQALIPNAQE